jgi:dihydropyrimidine dehydrogenase (NAD+) subunit PreA
LMGSAGVQICTAAMHHGFRIVEEMISGLNDYLDEKGIANVSELVGRSVERYTNWGDLDLNYKVVAHINTETCINCNKCYIACEDTAHQCIEQKTDASGKSFLQVREEDCVGCNLCSIVCPVDGAIDMVELTATEMPLTWNQRQQALAQLGSSTDSSSKEAVS